MCDVLEDVYYWCFKEPINKGDDLKNLKMQDELVLLSKDA